MELLTRVRPYLMAGFAAVLIVVMVIAVIFLAEYFLILPQLAVYL